ncbi:MAG: EF-hand domain-containing protein [Giesbergeria sp.]|nr:EF-hand domain-containing protein [Giesbergeria sp.]MDQ1259329.1 hypothetical protein [Pseudomonadota bacterium]
MHRTHQRPLAPVSAQRTLHVFDSRSVLLLAALTLGGAPALHAQTAPAAKPSATQSQSAGPAPKPVFGAGPEAPPSTAASAAFDRADANADGKLSPQEAQQLPAIGNRFEQLDNNRDGFLSRAEFEAGARS